MLLTVLSQTLLLLQVAQPAQDPVQSLVRIERSAAGTAALQALGLDLAAVTAAGIDVVCDARERAALDSAQIPYRVVHEDLSAFYAARLTPAERVVGTPPLGAWLTPPFGAGAMGGYYSYAQVGAVLDQIHAAYPALTTAKFSLGSSGQGRALWAIKVSDNPDTDEAEPEVRYDAMHHAREPQSMQCTLWILLGLLERYGTDPLSTYLVDEREIWFVPVVNPDGYERNRTTNPAGGGLWRKNRRDNGDGTFGVDLNRNYATQWGFDDLGSEPITSSETYRGPSAASEPEVQAMQAFIAARSFQTAVSAHTYSDLWLSPWGYIEGSPANAAQYDELDDLATQETGWTHGPAGITLYLANGVTFDHDHATRGTLAFTPEIGGDDDGFWPATNRIVPLAEETEPGLLRMAWAAGAYVRELGRTTAEVGDGDGFLEAGETLELVFDLRNSGRASSGTVELELTSPSPSASVTSGLVALPALASFTSADNATEPLALAIAPGTPVGTRIDYVAAVTYQGFRQEFPGSFFVGQPRRVLSDDLELEVGWTVGAPGDGATTGVWQFGNPLGALNGSAPSNPEDDATPGAGVRCFATGNGSTSAGTDDVDGGPTTLTSPRLDLSGVSGASVRYQRWFANATVLDDALVVSISDDDGASWTTLETVTGGSANHWEERTFAVEDFVTLTDRVRLRFVASDNPNNSVTEAAVDELSVVAFGAAPRLNFYGRAAVGGPLIVHVAGDAGQPYAVRAGPVPASIPLPFGTLLVQPSTSVRLLGGAMPASGLARLTLNLPVDPNLVGLTLYAQAATLGPIALSNRAAVTFH